MDQNAVGGFSCDATSSSGNTPYYQLSNPSNATGSTPYESESLSAQTPFSYYGLNGVPELQSGQVFPPPDSGVVPNPDGGDVTAPPIVYPVGQVTSKAFSVGPYGDATPVSSAPVSYGISAIQYAKDSSYFVNTGGAVPPPPQPGAPSGPPFGLALAAPTTTTQIPVIFDTAGITGSEPLTYRVVYWPRDIVPRLNNVVPAFLVLNPNGATTRYTAVLDNLTSSTVYNVQAAVYNGAGYALSPISEFSTKGGSVAPTGNLSTPVLFPAGTTNSQITVQFSVDNVAGNPAPQYFMYWGLAPNQFPTSVAATRVDGSTTLYRSTISGLSSGVNYYVMAFASNGVAPDLLSPQAGPFQTSSNNSPSAAPASPVAGTITPTSIALTCDVTGITGTPTPTFSLLYGTSFPLTNTFNMTVSGNTASANVTGLLPNTAYRFVAVAANGVPTNKESDPTLPIWTQTGASAAPKAPPGAFQTNKDPATAPTNTTVNLKLFGSDKVTGAPNPIYTLYYGLVAPPVTDPNAISGQITLPSPNTAPSFTLPTVTGLNVGTKYYFQVVASNGVSPNLNSTYVAVSTTGTPAPTNFPPSKPPTVPNAPSQDITRTTINAIFDTAGIQASPSAAYSLGFSTTSGGPYTFLPATVVSGTGYGALITNLTPGTTYYLVSKASNGISPDAISGEAQATTSPPAPASNLKTNLVAPFLLQGPRFGETFPNWTALDYYVNVGAVGATYQVGGSTTTGQQVFASMFAGTVGAAGNATGSTPPCQYAGACIADQPFAALGGSGATNYSDNYLKTIRTNLGNNGRILACWGGFYADILGLFGPYVPTGYPAAAQPTSTDVVSSFLYNYCGITTASNPLGWKRTNTSGNSGYTFYFDGLILDFENVGNGNPLNSWPFTPPAQPPSTGELNRQSQYNGYVRALAEIGRSYYEAAPTLFLGNAPVSLSIVQDRGQTNICAANTAFGTWFPFLTATEPPTASSYNTRTSEALNHPEQMSHFDDVFVQFYNEEADYYPGGQYFANLLACWGYVVLEAQKVGRKNTKINFGLAKGDIIPGGGAPFVASAQGPTPPLSGQSGPPYNYWYPQYETDSPPNNTADTTYATWPETGPNGKDAENVAKAIDAANTILRTAQNNQALVPSDWLSGMGFWAGSNATAMAQNIYNAANAASPAQYMATPSQFPAEQVYIWSDASYPAPNPNWANSSGFNVPIENNL